MSHPKFGESDKHGKKKAKTGDLEDGPSSFRSSPSPSWHGMENIPDGGIEDSGDISARKRVEDGGEEEELDPLMVFGPGIMMIILNKLDARSVALARLVSRDWCTVASSDKIWAPKDLFHMFRNGILNGYPIQFYLLLFCMEDYDSTFWGNDVSTIRDRPPI
ncbi:uncharacterized protein [Primulina huaijiensis]|uniref:uncharacterized protein isoform X2 n=1 Tax=Primulina huaijiensis TaxID=1492673 RepID=UPI003CC77AE2